MTRWVVGLAVLLATAGAASAQSTGRDGQPQSSTSNGAPSTSNGDPQAKAPATPDIVVEGLREEKQNIAATLVPMPSPLGFRRVAENSTMFARCLKNPDLDELRVLIDGVPNSAANRSALDWIIRTNKGCYRTYPDPPPNPPAFGDCNPQSVEGMYDGLTPTLRTCASTYDRGALLGAAIVRYVPDFRLTKKDVLNRAVVKRLNAREFARNHYRLPEDYAYFVTAMCMVGRQPELATRLVQAFGKDDLQARIGQLILVRAKGCVGDPRRVRVEPGQFTAYITDAAYRWEVAVRGVDSLLPVKP